jgi:D-alanine-D-alanine ligase
MDKNSSKDDLDVLDEVQLVKGAIRDLGYESHEVPVTLDLHHMLIALRKLDPVVVFNLVESIEGRDSLIHLVPSVLDASGIRYTGCPTESIHLTTNKLTAKNVYSLMGIPTPQWIVCDLKPVDTLPFDPPYIVKSVWEHASKNLDDGSVFHDRKLLLDALRDAGGEVFVEAFVDGREFNLTMLGGKDGPEVLPPQEILFVDFPCEKPKIVGYRAKWETDSFEYKNTQRTFSFTPEDAVLISEMKTISLECWRSLGLRGYARCDFRVDKENRPWLLEVNTNPCISPDSGFIAAAKEAGLGSIDVIRRIVDEALAGTKKVLDLRHGG